jgi:hypothetical protein
MDGYTIKDSGKRSEFAGGMVRDTAEGKDDWSNLRFGPMPRRIVRHLTKGRDKYPDPAPGIPNWTLGRGIDVWLHARESYGRHNDAYLAGLQDEDHGAAIYFNLNVMEYVRQYFSAEEEAQARAVEALQAELGAVQIRPLSHAEVLKLARAMDEYNEADTIPAPFTGTPYIEDAVLTSDGDLEPADLGPDPLPCGQTCTCPKVTFAHDLTTAELRGRGVKLECIQRVRGHAPGADLLARGREYIRKSDEARMGRHVAVPLVNRPVETHRPIDGSDPNAYTGPTEKDDVR